jgi:hypothetical protein
VVPTSWTTANSSGRCRLSLSIIPFPSPVKELQGSLLVGARRPTVVSLLSHRQNRRVLPQTAFRTVALPPSAIFPCVLFLAALSLAGCIDRGQNQVGRISTIQVRLCRCCQRWYDTPRSPGQHIYGYGKRLLGRWHRRLDGLRPSGPLGRLSQGSRHRGLLVRLPVRALGRAHGDGAGQAASLPVVYQSDRPVLPRPRSNLLPKAVPALQDGTGMEFLGCRALGASVA